MHDGRRRVHEALCRSDGRYLETTERASSASSEQRGRQKASRLSVDLGLDSAGRFRSEAIQGSIRHSAIRPHHTVTPYGAGAAASEKSVGKAGCVTVVKAAAAGIEMETPLPLPLPSSESECTHPSRRELEWRGRWTEEVCERSVRSLLTAGSPSPPPPPPPPPRGT